MLAATAATLLMIVALNADASISGTLQADRLEDQNGVAVPTSGLFLLVASTVDSNFTINLNLLAGKSTAIGSVLGGDDTVIFRGNLSGAGTAGVLDQFFTIDLTSLVFNNLLTPGDRLALLWFPTLTIGTGGETILPAGARFGFYDGGVANSANATDSDSTASEGGNPWVLPADPTTGYIPNFHTKDATIFGSSSSPNAAAAGRATGLVLVPEPSSGLLGLLGFLGFLGLRRRRA